MRLLIIGGVAAGASTAARYRRLNEDAEIIMFEKGPFVSFSNCCLPYHINGDIPNSETLILMDPKKFITQYNIQAKVNSEVIAVNPEAKTVTVKDTLTGETREETYDKLMVSPGARAFDLQAKGIETAHTYNLKTVPDVVGIMDSIEKTNAKTAVVIGGGYIGVEAAETLTEKGLKVTLIEGTNQILQPFDEDMVSFLHSELIDKGINLVLNEKVVEFDHAKVITDKGNTYDGEVVITAIGVRPDTDFLKDSGIEMNDKGYMLVNDQYRTNFEDIYAGGDAILVKNQLTGKQYSLPLAGPANKQGRLIADAIAGLKFTNKGYISSACVKAFDFSGASTGLNEKDLANTDFDYEVAYALSPEKVGIMPQARQCFTKLIFEKGTGKVLGAQAVSQGEAVKRVDVFATAIKAGMTVEDLWDLELCYAPTFGTGKDIVNKAGYIAHDLLKGDYKQVRFSDVFDLVKENAQIVDVREDFEYANGHIKGAISMPMSRMRQEFNNLDKSRPVYVHCKIGQRSYNMALLLQGKGFDVYNIAGSYDMVVAYEKGRKILDPNREEIIVK